MQRASVCKHSIGVEAGLGTVARHLPWNLPVPYDCPTSKQSLLFLKIPGTHKLNKVVNLFDHAASQIRFKFLFVPGGSTMF